MIVVKHGNLNNIMMFYFHEKFQHTINFCLNIFLKQEVFQSNVNRTLDDNGYVLNSFEC